MSNSSSTRNIIDELPKGVKENLSQGEKILYYLKTFQVVEKPDYILLTNYRIIYFNEKHLGRYDYKIIPFQKLLEMKAQRGAMLWGSITIKSEDDTEIGLNKVDREELEPFINALKDSINNIAVEPISIEYKRGFLGEANWEFNKPAEMIFKQPQSNQQTSPEEPIAKLKMMYVNGEISEQEYRTKLRVLQES